MVESDEMIVPDDTVEPEHMMVKSDHNVGPDVEMVGLDQIAGLEQMTDIK